MNNFGSFVLVVCYLAAVSPATAATKVFLLGGQSNMAGLGGYEGDDPYIPTVPADKPCPAPYNQPQTAVKFWSEQTSGQWGNLQPGYGFHWTPGGKTFGPEVGFGYAIHNAFPQDDIYLIKYAASSTNLAVDWNPNGSGAMYNGFKSIVTTAMASLGNAQIAGMIWMQGESDCYANNPNADAHSAAYATNLTNFISKVRSDFQTPEMPFVLGRITTYWGTPENNALVRSAQETVPGIVDHASWIDTDDLTWAYVGHYGTDGQIALGTRFAGKFIPTPEPSSVVLASAGLLCVVIYAWPTFGRRLRRGIGFAGVLLALAGPMAATAHSQQAAIVAFGDSTTAPRGELVVYATLVEKGLLSKNIPAKVINAGVPGHTTVDARARFEKDVLAHNPNLVIIQFGINDSAVDVWKDPPATVSRVSLADFEKNLRYFAQTLKSRRTEVILMTPNPLRWTDEMRKLYGNAPYQPNDADGFNAVLSGYADAVRRVARQENATLIDVYQAFEAYGKEPGQSVDDLLLDGVHPNGNGQQLVAKLLLSSNLLGNRHDHEQTTSGQ